MAKYKSDVKLINSRVEDVYTLLSDLTNWEPLLEAALNGQKQDDKLGEVEDIQCTTDELSIKVQGISITLKVVDLEENKTIKLESTNSPFPFNLWIQLKPKSDYETNILLTFKVELNLVMRGMLAKPLKNGINKVAEMLATIDYPQLIRIAEEYKKKKELEN